MVAMSLVCGSSCAVKPVQRKLYDNKCAARNAVPGQRHLVNSNVCNVRVSVASHRISTCGLSRRLHNFRSNAVAEQSVTANSADVQNVEFSWDGDAREVQLTGDFLKWDERLSLTKNGNGLFSLFQKLAPGTYKYKFIVDGEWRHSTACPAVPDGNGGFNNSVSVVVKAEASPSSSAAPPSPDSGSPPPAKKAVAAKKAAAKPMAAAMSEDIIPMLKEALEKETGLSELTLTFQNNQLRGSFAKGGVPYCIYAFFPDGSLDGSRGFALTSYNAQPSTVEPFLIDERKVTPDLVVFWIRKRLFAQKLLSLN